MRFVCVRRRLVVWWTSASTKAGPLSRDVGAGVRVRVGLVAALSSSGRYSPPVGAGSSSWWVCGCARGRACGRTLDIQVYETHGHGHKHGLCEDKPQRLSELHVVPSVSAPPDSALHVVPAVSAPSDSALGARYSALHVVPAVSAPSGLRAVEFTVVSHGTPTVGSRHCSLGAG